MCKQTAFKLFTNHEDINYDIPTIYSVHNHGYQYDLNIFEMKLKIKNIPKFKKKKNYIILHIYTNNMMHMKISCCYFQYDSLFIKDTFIKYVVNHL